MSSRVKKHKPAPQRLDDIIARLLDDAAAKELIEQSRALLRWMTEAAKLEDTDRYMRLVSTYVHIQKVIFIWANIIYMRSGEGNGEVGEDLFVKLLDKLGLPPHPPPLVHKKVMAILPKDSSDTDY